MTKEQFILTHLPPKLAALHPRDRSTLQAIHDLANLYDQAAILMAPKEEKPEPVTKAPAKKIVKGKKK